MPNADGSIIIKADVDDKDAEKRLNQLNKTIEKTEKTISRLEKKKLTLVDDALRLGFALDEAKKKLEYMKSGVEFFPESSISEQAQIVSDLQKQFNAADKKAEDVANKIKDISEELGESKIEAGILAEKMTTLGYQAGEAAEKVEKSFNKFKMRLREVLRSALVFTLITQSLSKFREWMGRVVQTNAEATAAMARLKGALLTLAQPLVGVLIPAFTAFLNVLTAIVGEISKIVSGLFGATVEQSAEAAENLQSEVDALNDTGAAAKKAGKSLASFDEINKLSSNQSEGAGGGNTNTENIAPDFSWMDGVTDKLAQIAKDVLLIGAGFALWKIASSLPGQLGKILSILGGLLIAMGGILLFYEGFTDAWENGVDWGNLAAMIAGVAAAAFGLYVVFGSIGAGIALVVGGIAMLVLGFRDVIKNGANMKNTLLIIAGIIATGLGIALLTGSLIPLLIAGIIAIIAAVIAWQGNLGEFAEAFRQIFDGIIDFFVGVFTGDFERAWKGIRNVVIGIINAIVIAFESFINAVIDGLNWLISKANSLADTVGIGSFIPEIPKLKLPRIPYLAQGAVIPPNREFLAVLGDQKNGTNIETPLSTMVEAFRTAMRDMNMSGGQSEAYLMVDNEVLGKIIYKLYNKESHRVGVKLSEA